jgi:hypothetical protein
MPRRFEVEPAPALLAGALVLGLGIQVALPQPSPLADVAPAGASRSPLSAGRDPSRGVEARLAIAPAYPAILDRPLFSPGRSQASAVVGDVAPPGALALLGVASDGGRASATLVAPGGAPRSLRLGEAIQGWRLSGVGRDHALLSRGLAVQVLKVGAPPQTPPSPAAATPTGVAPL